MNDPKNTLIWTNLDIPQLWAKNELENLSNSSKTVWLLDLPRYTIWFGVHVILCSIDNKPTLYEPYQVLLKIFLPVLLANPCCLVLGAWVAKVKTRWLLKLKKGVLKTIAEIYSINEYITVYVYWLEI